MQTRAKQFMPFDSLDGYYDMIDEANVVITPKRDLTLDEENRLNAIIYKIKNKMIIKICYYEKNGYYTRIAMLSEVSLSYRYIKIIKKKINFDDILSIEIVKDIEE